MTATRAIVLFMLVTSGAFLFSQNISVPGQDGCPVRIVRTQFLKPGSESTVSLVAQNASTKAIEAIGFKASVTRNSGAGATFGTLLVISLLGGHKAIQPNQIVNEAIPLGWSEAESDRDSISVLVDYVLFADGTHWGADTLKYGKTISDMRTGALLYQKQSEQTNSESPK